MSKIIFISMPGAGKTTIANELSKLKKIEHVSTGNYLRSESKKE